jgi:hypothetical protein
VTLNGTIAEPEPECRVRTPEELEAERQRLREIDLLMAERSRLRKFASTRADRLLQSQLTVEQRRSLKDRGYFLVVGQSGKRYRIREGYSRNVDLLNDKGKPVKTYCAHPGESLPNGEPLTRTGRYWHDRRHAVQQVAQIGSPVRLERVALMPEWRMDAARITEGDAHDRASSETTMDVSPSPRVCGGG